MDEEDESEGSITVLVLYDDHLDALWALRVSSKGATPEAIKLCCDKLEDSGCNGVRIATKSDQEVSIVDLRRAVSARRLG